MYMENGELIEIVLSDWIIGFNISIHASIKETKHSSGVNPHNLK